MKKILYSLLTLAAALTVASCQKEPANPDPIYGGKTVETAFTVDLDELPTKAYADGKTADKLLVLVYGADGLVASQSKISPDDAIPISNLKANVTVKFVKGQTYDIVFWAQAEDAPFTLDAATGKLTVANSGPANDENRDAFWYVEKGYVATANDKETVTLKRPFAQINVLLAEEFDAGTKSKMTVENMPNVIDLRSENGDVSGSVTYTFTEAELDDATFDKKYVSGKNYAYGGMNYILVQKGENPVSAAVSFTVTCTNDDLGTIEIEKSLTGVPVKRNYRTNITYSPSASRDYTVIVNPAWDGTNDDISADAEANEFTVQVGGNEFANNATLTMAPNETVNVTITDANGKAPESAESSDPEVVTVEAAQGGGYELAALKKGSADINFHIDPYTKQDVQGADFTIKVNVPGDPVLESIAVDTKNATTTFALNGTFSSEGIVVTATYDEGDPKDVTAAATVSTPDMSTAGEKTVTVSYAEGGVSKETTYTITVEGETPPVVATLTGITVDASGATTTFTVGDTFISEGIKVTATYSDESTKDVTEKATVPTAPDMNTAGEKTVTVSYTEGEGDSANTKTATYTITVNEGDTPPAPAAGTIADIKAAFAQDGSLSFNGTIANVIVTYVNGKNAYIEDATGGLLVYADGHEFKAGETLAGSVTLEGTTYQGLKEITTFTKGNDFTATEGATIPVTTVTLAQLNSNIAQYESMRVKVEDVTMVAAAKDRSKSVGITQGNDTFTIFTKQALSNEVGQGAVVDIIGYPGLHNEDKQLNVWVYSDFTIKSSGVETSSISIASSKTLKPGDTFDLASIVTYTPESATLKYAISGSSNITLSGSTVTVAAGAANGDEAVVTLSIDEVEGSHTAATATCTIKVQAGALTSYTLDGEAIKAAHTAAWTYESGSKTITATDGSEWIAYNTFASTNQVTVQMNKGKSAYVLTPTVPSGKKITKITVVTNKKNDGTGDPGDRPLDIQSADGTQTLHSNVTNYANGLAISGNHTALRVICNEANGGATYIVSITIDFE